MTRACDGFSILDTESLAEFLERGQSGEQIADTERTLGSKCLSSCR